MALSETAADEAIRRYAGTDGSVIITKDEDFAVRRVLQEGPPWRVSPPLGR